VKPRESADFERATLGIGQHFGDLRVGTSEIGGDLTKLLLDGFAVPLGENGAYNMPANEMHDGQRSHLKTNVAIVAHTRTAPTTATEARIGRLRDQGTNASNAPAMSPATAIAPIVPIGSADTPKPPPPHPLMPHFEICAYTKRTKPATQITGAIQRRCNARSEV